MQPVNSFLAGHLGPALPDRGQAVGAGGLAGGQQVLADDRQVIFAGLG